MASSEHTARVIDFVVDSVPARAGFRVTRASPFAGGPIDLEFAAEVDSDQPRHLFIAADRMRGRPGDFCFAASFAGTPLADPFEGVPDFGGPAGAVAIARGRPLLQPIYLNQFVCLEAVLDLLEPGAAGRLLVGCRRSLRLAADEETAIAQQGEPFLVAVELAIELRRDDTALDEFVARLVADVRDGPPGLRERSLSILRALRAPAAVARWRALVAHPDPLVAERVRQALAQLPARQP